MTAATVNALADYLASVDADWRRASGYTGRPVHRRAYWRNMAARLLTDSVKVLADKDNNLDLASTAGSEPPKL